MTLFQQLHGLYDLLIDALAPAAVGGLLKAPLQRDGGDEVFHPQHVVGKFLVDQGGVGEAQEDAVIVLVAQGNQVILAHHGLAAGVDIDVNAQILALGDDIVDLVKGQVELVAVLRRPAAHAVEVAGGGGVQQNGPGTLQLYFWRISSWRCQPTRLPLTMKLVNTVLSTSLSTFFTKFTMNLCQLSLGVVDDPADDLPLLGKTVGAVTGKPIYPGHQLGQIFLRVLSR